LSSSMLSGWVLDHTSQRCHASADASLCGYPTEDAALQDIERCKREDRMYETAKQLVDIAIKAHMERFGVDRETARYWVCSAAEASD